MDFPPWQTVYRHFARWEETKVTEQLMAVLRRRLRTAQGHGDELSAGIIDSQSVKGADTVGQPTQGYHAGKKVNGRKRFIVTDTLGLLLVVCVMAASVQDRDGARTTLLSLYLCTPVWFVFADAGFAGRLVDWAERFVATILHIARKAPGQVGFAVIPRRELSKN
ncbi:transposase [Nocardiopsis sp. JB363]|uniref:transposase n=1 Tax=Nocardiopsis sp. JB363 TaxID=1434837 RepID=UPI00097A8B0C|nr:transposase [Nocardiopsis sp. JB363]SIO86340.1 putative transposase [Nocardiopsis sp. JB363]